jgi:hypothetical protein
MHYHPFLSRFQAGQKKERSKLFQDLNKPDSITKSGSFTACCQDRSQNLKQYGSGRSRI